MKYNYNKEQKQKNFKKFNKNKRFKNRHHNRRNDIEYSDESDFNDALTPFDMFSDPFFASDDDDDMMNPMSMFKMSSSNAPGTVFTKSYVTKVNYKNGKPEHETYESQSIKQIGRDGHNIQEAQEKYENSRTGEQKATHSRHLDGKGQKMIKKRNRLTGETESQNILNGIKEEELGDFDKKYNDYREKVDFKKNYQFFNNQMRIKGNENKEKVKMLPSSKEENN